MEGGRDEGSASDRGAIEIESETAEPQKWANLFNQSNDRSRLGKSNLLV